MTRTRAAALLAILTATLGAAGLFAVAAAADPVPSFTLEVRARPHDSGRIEFGVRTDAGVRFPRPASCRPQSGIVSGSSARRLM